MTPTGSELSWGDSPVERVGDTVRRRTGPWTATVHALLDYLHGVGFAGIPRVLGFDDQGREVLGYVDGVDGRRGRRFDDATLIQEARLLRRFHDAVRGFVPPSTATWRSGTWQWPSEPGDDCVICHNDLAPYNVLYSAGVPHCIIDWDLAGPAPTNWDVAYAAWRFVPLYPDEVCRHVGCAPDTRADRLRVFCDAYGLDTRDHLLGTLRARLLAEDSEFATRSIEVLDDNEVSWLGAIS